MTSAAPAGRRPAQRKNSPMRSNALLTSSCLFALALSAAGNANAVADDLLTVDWTVGVQLVTFIVALWLLNKLVFRPLLRVRDRREELTAGTLKEAEEMTRRAEETIAEYERRIAEARAAATETRNELRQRGQAEAAGILASAREEAQAELERKRAVLEGELSGIRAGLRSEAESLAASIAERVLGGEGAGGR